jgi:hypothetical protein
MGEAARCNVDNVVGCPKDPIAGPAKAARGVGAAAIKRELTVVQGERDRVKRIVEGPKAD